MGDASWLGAAGGGGPMAAAAADAEERAERFVGLLPGGGGRPLFVDILQWELGLDQKRKVVVRGQERCPPVRPALAQCDKCQKLGHTSKGCKAQTTCAYCAGRHATKHHRSRCTDCATDAIPVDQDCPHPPYCANCKGIHQATDPVCPNKKKYAATAAKDSAAPDPSMEL